MADGRKNPLIGAFRTPVAETPPKASEPSKADEGKKPAAPPKVTVDPKPPVADPGKPGEDKKPTEQPKAATDPKTPATADPGKPSGDKKPVKPSKAATAPKAPATAAPGKPGEDKKPVEPPKATTDPKAPAAADPGKSADGKKPVELSKAATDPKAPAAADGIPTLVVIVEHHLTIIQELIVSGNLGTDGRATPCPPAILMTPLLQLKYYYLVHFLLSRLTTNQLSAKTVISGTSPLMESITISLKYPKNFRILKHCIKTTEFRPMGMMKCKFLLKANW